MAISESALFKHFSIWPLVILALLGLVSEPFGSGNILFNIGVFCIFLVGIIGSVYSLAFSNQVFAQMVYVVLTAIYVAISGYILIYHLLNLTGQL